MASSQGSIGKNIPNMSAVERHSAASITVGNAQTFIEKINAS
jgi:hypothetical protein